MSRFSLEIHKGRAIVRSKRSQTWNVYHTMCVIVSTGQSTTLYPTYNFRIFGSFCRKSSSRFSSISIPFSNRICMGYDGTKVEKFFRSPKYIGASTKPSFGGLGYTSRRHNLSYSNNANVHFLFISIPTSVAFYMTLRS